MKIKLLLKLLLVPLLQDLAFLLLLSLWSSPSLLFLHDQSTCACISSLIVTKPHTKVNWMNREFLFEMQTSDTRDLQGRVFTDFLFQICISVSSEQATKDYLTKISFYKFRIKRRSLLSWSYHRAITKICQHPKQYEKRGSAL